MSSSLSRRELIQAMAALAAVGPTAAGCGSRQALGGLSLPGSGLPEPERLAMLEAAREAYRYDYNKANLRGLAMCERLPPTEAPAQAWVERMVEVLVQLGENDASTRGAPAPDPKALLERLSRPGVNPAAVAFDEAARAEEGAKTEGQASALKDFDAQFGAVPKPAVAGRFRDDSEFARMRLAGPNPVVLRQVAPKDGLPDDFGVTEELARVGLAEGDSLKGALAEGRLFMCSYRELLGVEPGAHPGPPELELNYAADNKAWDAAYAARERAYREGGRQKLRIAPLALFAVPPGGGALRPVAIQALPNGVEGKTYPTFTPADGVAWLRAKTLVNTADASMHEVTTHLALTHMVQEAFALAMHNCLAIVHPLHALLAPHFEGTFLINNAADLTLVDSGSPVDQLLLPTMGGSIKLGADSLKAFHFQNAALPTQLKLRGVADAALITDYPYRDDGLLVWGATERWVSRYVNHHYADDSAVVSDHELQAFATQVGQYKQNEGGRLVGGGVRGVGPVRDRAELTALLTGIIFNGSAQHAAVNFPQGGPLCYTPNMPLSAYGPLPEPGDTQEAWLAQLPSLDLSRLQLRVTWLLGATRYTQLGRYRAGAFEGGEVQAALSQHQGELADIEATIDERNKVRVDYPFLKPSLIPQSINI
jgi:arachidonate 15-lipoxygenase